MEPIDLPNARTNLLALVSAAQRGEDVCIARNGRVVVRIVPVEARLRTAGALLDILRRRPRPDVNNRANLDTAVSDTRESWGS